jgi:hypothetical protein
MTCFLRITNIYQHVKCSVVTEFIFNRHQSAPRTSTKFFCSPCTSKLWLKFCLWGKKVVYIVRIKKC